MHAWSTSDHEKKMRSIHKARPSVLVVGGLGKCLRLYLGILREFDVAYVERGTIPRGHYDHILVFTSRCSHSLLAQVKEYLTRNAARVTYLHSTGLDGLRRACSEIKK